MKDSLNTNSCCHCSHHSFEILNRKRTFFVIIISFITMLFEVIFGFITNSMALLSDGFHMLTHVVALFITYIAYIFICRIREYENSNIVADKISAFAGYTSSLFLLLTGFWIIYEACERVLNPLKISFDEAIIVAIIGLIVNAVCIFIMEFKNKHSHSDYNFKSAYVHILTDLMTSVFAVFALLLGKYFGLNYFDTVMGFIGGYLVIRWSVGLIIDTSKVLLDTNKLSKKQC